MVFVCRKPSSKHPFPDPISFLSRGQLLTFSIGSHRQRVPSYCPTHVIRFWLIELICSMSMWWQITHENMTNFRNGDLFADLKRMFSLYINTQTMKIHQVDRYTKHFSTGEWTNEQCALLQFLKFRSFDILLSSCATVPIFLCLVNALFPTF